MMPAPLLAAALLHATLASLQAGPHFDARDRATPDSAATLRQLRGAQETFERTRRHHLPWTWGFSGGRCDLVVGRFCYWDDDTEGWTAPEEPEAVALARHAFLARLDSASRRFPGDGWIQGQRIRYLVESARYQDALWAVRDCRAAPHWCAALAGYVLHVMTDFGAADSAFARALAAMPDTLRCEWTDLGLLLDGLRGRYRDLDCARRDSLNAVIWWLADPSYVVPGNERRTAHYARHVVTRLFDGSANPYGISWGRDNRELVLRYGWAIGWERERPRSHTLGARPSVVGHHADGALHFLPPADFVESPSTIGPDDWDLDPHIPRSRYAPGYAARFSPLHHQLALFRRGDSAVVVAGFDLAASLAESHPDRPPHPRGNAIAGLMVTRDPHDPTPPTTLEVSDHRGALAVTVPRAAAIVGVEIVDHADSSIGRTRYWVDVPARTPGGLALSELLLLARADTLPRSLTEAIPRARGGNRFAPGEPIGLFWEIYGLPAATPPEVRITVFKESKGPTMSLGWDGTPDTSDGPAGRAVSIRLPGDDTGRFRIRLEVETDGRVAVSETEVVVRRE